MAYVPGQKIDDGTQEGAQAPGAPAAPSISGPSMGSTASVGGSAAGSSPIAQPSAPGVGTGFTNIDSYLNANKGASGAVKTAADKALATDSTAFGTAKKTVDDNVAAQNKPIVDPSKLVDSALTGGAAGIDAAKGVIGNTFKGPGTVDYNIGNTDQMKQAQSLGNSASAGTQLAQNHGPLLGYQQSGLNAIDAAVYGSQQEKPTLDNVVSATKGQVESQNTAKGATEKAAGDTAASIAKQAADTKAAFQAKAASLQGDAHTKAVAAQAASDAAQAAMGMTNQKIRDSNNQNRDFNVGQIGDTSAGNRGSYVDPKTGKTVYEGESGAATKQATNGMSPEELQRFQAIKAANPNVSSSYAADKARNWKAPAEQSLQAWDNGSGLANDSSFLDSNGLSAIGNVLGDQQMAATKAGPAYVAGHAVSANSGIDSNGNRVSDDPGAQRQPLPPGYTYDARGNVIKA